MLCYIAYNWLCCSFNIVMHSTTSSRCSGKVCLKSVNVISKGYPYIRKLNADNAWGQDKRASTLVKCFTSLSDRI